MHVPWPRVWKLWQVLGVQFFGTIVLYWWNLSWKNPCQQLCIFSVPLPTNEAMHVPSPNDCKPLEKSWAHSFSGQSHWWNLSWNPCQLCFSVCRVLPTEQAVSHGFPSVHHVHASISPLTKLSPSYFPRFPLRSSCRRFHLAPWETSVGKERDGSDDRVEGRETVGNSLGRAPLGRSEIEESTWVDKRETVENSSGRALLGRRDTEATTRVSLPSRQRQLNENPSIGDAFGKNAHRKKKISYQPGKNNQL